MGQDEKEQKMFIDFILNLFEGMTKERTKDKTNRREHDKTLRDLFVHTAKITFRKERV